MPTSTMAGLNRQSLVHIARTTVAATVSLTVAQLVGLPQPHWAAISTMVVTQSTVGAAWTVSVQRFMGTALGAAAAALLAYYARISISIFGLGVFGLGLVCAILRLDRAAYRFAGITLAVVALSARADSVWVLALDRF